MGLLFTKTVDAFYAGPPIKIINSRLKLNQCKFLNRIDLTFQSNQDFHSFEYPYLENINTLGQLLPVPMFLLRPLKRYHLPYGIYKSDVTEFSGSRTIIYIHGSGSISEDNSILHRLLLNNDCNLIRVSYHIDYEKEGIIFPRKAEQMLKFLDDMEEKIAPVLNGELTNALDRLKDEYPGLFVNQEVIVIAHSLGGGLAANLIAKYDRIKFSKFINLDGTLMNPAIQAGLNVKQLHLSQDHLFKKEWIHEDNFKDPLKAIGQDYCKKIDTLIKNSTNKSIWIQVKDSSHFTFTDFPNLLKSYKVFKRLVGDRESALRIRNYVINFILEPDELKVESKDYILKNE